MWKRLLTCLEYEKQISKQWYDALHRPHCLHRLSCCRVKVSGQMTMRQAAEAQLLNPHCDLGEEGQWQPDTAAKFCCQNHVCVCVCHRAAPDPHRCDRGGATVYQSGHRWRRSRPQSPECLVAAVAAEGLLFSLGFFFFTSLKVLVEFAASPEPSFLLHGGFAAVPLLLVLKKLEVMVNLLIRSQKVDLLTLWPCVFKVYECLQRFLGDSPTPVLNNATGVLFQVMLTLICRCHFVAPAYVFLVFSSSALWSLQLLIDVRALQGCSDDARELCHLLRQPHLQVRGMAAF